MKKIFILALLAISTLNTINATDRDGVAAVRTEVSQDKHAKHIGRFADNWYVNVGAGVNLFINNGSLGVPGFAPEANLGKWLTPHWGFRLGYQGFRNQATDTSAGWFAGKEQFGFHYVHIDWVYNPIGCERRFNVNPYIHAGTIFTTWNDVRITEFGTGLGIMLDFRIVGNLHATVDARVTLAREEAWRSTAGSSFIGYASATGGLAYNFGWGKKGKVGFESHTREVVVVKELIECTHEAQIAALKAEIDSLRNQPAPVAVEAAPRVFRYSVYFDLNKSNLLDKERFHLKDIMEALKGLENVSVSLSGHADKETGTKRRNRVLSEERVEVVSAYLRSLGFDGQINTSAFGDEANPYHDEIPMNRCAVVEVRY